MNYDINIGDKILDWTVLDNTPIKETATRTKIKCQCKCGTIKLVNRYTLTHQGYPKNCGCDRPNHMKEKSKELGNKLIGTIKNNFHGTPMKIIEYNNSGNIIIEFQDEHKFRKRTTIKEFNRGKVRNPYDKTIFGVGYYGFDYMPTGKNMGDKFNRCYNVWHHMLRRCYDKEYQINKQPAYIGCSVCDEWLSFKNFSEWYFENYIDFGEEKSCLDKDILYKGNKIYSPKTCCFVPNEINCLFTKTTAKRGELPIGVYYRKDIDRYVAQCKIGGGLPQKNIGTFKNPIDAFNRYKEFKENRIKEIADKYKEIIKDNVYEAMYNYKVEITD